MFKRFWWLFPVCLITGPLLGLLVGGVIAYITPKQYESSATIQVREIDSAAVAAGRTHHSGSSSFIATELEVIRAPGTLDIAIDQLDLTSRWSMDRAQVTEQLRKAITTRNIEGTDLIDIRVRAFSPQDAREIAEAVSEAYRTRRQELASRRTDTAMAELRQAIFSQEDLVEEKRKILLQVTQAKAAEFQDEEQEEAVAHADYAVDEAKSELKAAQALLEQLKVKRVSEEMQSKLGGDSVIVHAEPVESMVPAAPNVTLLLMLGAAGGLLLGILAPFALIPVLHAIRK